MNVSTRDTIAKLDKCPAPPNARAQIAYRILCETNRRDDLVNEVMIQYRLGFENENRLLDLTERLSEKRSGADPSKDNSRFHLAWGMLPNDDNLDGYLAEYYYNWAASLGVQEDRISDIIFELGGIAVN